MIYDNNKVTKFVMILSLSFDLVLFENVRVNSKVTDSAKGFITPFIISYITNWFATSDELTILCLNSIEIEIDLHLNCTITSDYNVMPSLFVFTEVDS